MCVFIVPLEKISFIGFIMSDTVITDEVSTEIRNYFCRGCTKKETGISTPKHWYVVRKVMADNEMPKTIALYHDSRCLVIDVLMNLYNITKSHVELLLEKVSNNR